MSDVIGKGKYSGKTLMTQEWLNYMKETEDFHAEAYKTTETAKYYTIGYGFDYIREGDNFTEWVKNLNKEREVEESDTITREIADEYMLFLIEYICYDGIAKNFQNIIGKLNRFQLSSLIDIAYNCGRGALIKSNIMKLVKENPDDPQIGVEIEKFQISSKFPGLAVRRKICAEYYFNGKLNKNTVPTVKYQTDSINEVKYSSTNDCNANNCIIDDNSSDNDGDNSNNVNQESYDYYVGLQKQANEGGRPCNIRMINELHKLDYIEIHGVGKPQRDNSNKMDFVIKVLHNNSKIELCNFSFTFDEDMYKSSNIKIGNPIYNKQISKEKIKCIKEIFETKYSYMNDLNDVDINYFEEKIICPRFKYYQLYRNNLYKEYINNENEKICNWKKDLNDKNFEKLAKILIDKKYDFVTIKGNCNLNDDRLNINNEDILITRMEGNKGNNIFNVFITKGDTGYWTKLYRLKGSSYRKG